MTYEGMVPCKWCKRPTPMIGTEECNNCWEIRNRVGLDIDAAEKIVKAVRKGKT